MEKNNSTKIIIGAFIVIMIAIAFLTSIVGQTSNVTEKTNIADEITNLTTSCYTSGQVNESNPACNITVINYPTSWKIEDCPLTNVVVSNETGTALVLNTDYKLFASSGIIQMINTTDTNSANFGENVLIDYTYCGDNYMNLSWGRNILGINIGIFAIAILIVIISAALLLLKSKEN